MPPPSWYMLAAVTVETPNDEAKTLSDRAFLEGLARQVSGIVGLVDGLSQDAQVTLGLLEMHAKQLDHIDTMVHEVHQFIEEHRPALNRALNFLDAGKSMRGYLAGRPRKGATDGTST